MSNAEERINHNLNVAKPMFLYFVDNMNKELSQWIQYAGAESEGSQIYFTFKSSQNSLTFKVYAGVNVNDVFYLLKGKTNFIYHYFNELILGSNNALNKGSENLTILEGQEMIDYLVANKISKVLYKKKPRTIYDIYLEGISLCLFDKNGNEYEDVEEDYQISFDSFKLSIYTFEKGVKIHEIIKNEKQ